MLKYKKGFRREIFIKKRRRKNDNNILINDEEASLKSENKSKKDDKNNEFTLIQKISLVFFILGFIIMIIGASVLGCWLTK